MCRRRSVAIATGRACAVPPARRDHPPYHPILFACCFHSVCFSTGIPRPSVPALPHRAAVLRITSPHPCALVRNRRCPPRSRPPGSARAVECGPPPTGGPVRSDSERIKMACDSLRELWGKAKRNPLDPASVRSRFEAEVGENYLPLVAACWKGT